MKLEQFSVSFAKISMEYLTFLSKGSLIFLVPWEIFLSKKM